MQRPRPGSKKTEQYKPGREAATLQDMRAVTVLFKQNNVLTTSINGSDDEVREYYKVGKEFNLGTGADGEPEDNMQPVVAVYFAREAYLLEFNELARQAHSHTSFDPDKRGVSIIREYTNALEEDLTEIEGATKEAKERYIAGYKSKFSAWLQAKSRCMSSMITGPSNFPVRRAEKANNSEHNKSEDFYQFRVKATKGILKGIERAKPQDQKDSEAWEVMKKGMARKIATIVNYDLGINTSFHRVLIVNSLVNPILTAGKNGNVVLVGNALAFLREANELNKKDIVSSRHGVWKMEELAKANAEKKEKRATAKDVVHYYKGFKVVFCIADERIRIIHEDKPEREVIQEIKKHGFRWSPFNTAWQRKITNNALYVLKSYLSEFKRLPNVEEVEGVKEEQPEPTAGAGATYEEERERQLKAGEIEPEQEGISLYHMSKAISSKAKADKEDKPEQTDNGSSQLNLF